MKKLFLFSVAALAFCACSSDEVVSENSAAIRFDIFQIVAILGLVFLRPFGMSFSQEFLFRHALSGRSV